jgi:hypothetical protein
MHRPAFQKLEKRLFGKLGLSPTSGDAETVPVSKFSSYLEFRRMDRVLRRSDAVQLRVRYTDSSLWNIVLDCHVVFNQLL